MHHLAQTMTGYDIETLVFCMLGFIIVIASGAIIAGLFLKLSAWLVAKVRVPCCNAISYAFFVIITNLALGTILAAFVIALWGPGFFTNPLSLTSATVFFAAMTFCVASILYGRLVRDVNDLPIGIGKGFIVTLVMLIFFAILGTVAFFGYVYGLEPNGWNIHKLFLPVSR